MLQDFQRELREYCWDIANMKSNEDTLLDEAKLIEKTDNIAFSDALMQVAERKPHLTEPRTLKINPSDALYNLAEAAGGDLIEAVTLVKAKNPDLTRLSELYEEDNPLFEAACRRAGSQSGTFRATESNVISKVLLWSELVSDEIEGEDWPKNPKTGERMSIDEVIKVVL